MAPISLKLPYGESNEVGTSPFKLSLQTQVRLTFVNIVNTADIQITRVSESYETKRLNINTECGGVFVEDSKGKFCEKWSEILRRKNERGGGELRPTITMFWA